MNGRKLLTKRFNVWETCYVGGYLVIIVPMVIALIIGDPFDWTLWGILTACCEVVLICIICLLYLLFSNNIEFSENAILYYRTILSKKTMQIIPYDAFDFVVVNNWDTIKKRTYTIRYGYIYFCQGSNIVFAAMLNWKIMYTAIIKFGENKVNVVSENFNYKTVSQHYDTDYSSLSEKTKMKLIKTCCTYRHGSKKYAKRILSKGNK